MHKLFNPFWSSATFLYPLKTSENHRFSEVFWRFQGVWKCHTGLKLVKHDFRQNWLKFYDKMDLPIRIGIICNMKYRHAIRLRFGDKFLTSLAKLVLEAKPSICFTIRKTYFYIIASCLTSFKQYFNCPSDKPLFTNQESSYAYFCLKQELFLE